VCVFSQHLLAWSSPHAHVCARQIPSIGHNKTLSLSDKKKQTKKNPRATIPAKVRFVTHKKLVAMGKVLIFISDASQILGMTEIGGGMERERRRITVSRMVISPLF